MPIRFEFRKNGQTVRTAGVHDQGTLVFTFDYGAADPKDHATATVLGIDLSGELQQMSQWPMPGFHVGDELTLRILPPGEFDPPEDGYTFTDEYLEDAEFGKMGYQIDSWQFSMPFEFGPLKTACVRCRAEAELTQALRQRFRSLQNLHAEAWPNILEALVSCHDKLTRPEDIESRLNSQVAIHLNEESPVEFVYSVDGDEPESRAYFVTVDDGKVADAFVAD